jgi:hypothetical protein
LELLRRDNEAQIARIEAECKAELHRMKSAAIREEQQMKTQLETELGNAPNQIAASSQTFQAELREERSRWQAKRGIEIRNELQAKFEADVRRHTEKQERLIGEMTEKLKEDARLENRQLIDEQTNLASKNKEIETEIQMQIRNATKEIEELRESRAMKRGEKQRLTERVRKCECRKWRFQIEEEQRILSGLSDELEKEKQKAVQAERNHESQLSEAKELLRAMEAENAELTHQLKRQHQDLEEQQRLAKGRLQALQDRHQNEIQMIGIPVRQTVEKKDAVIQQLMNRLHSLTGTTNGF